ncbi:MAG: GNAT family N-acetyltransferase [bacterium]|nr:GNAT family N-acetyltransferase [bacterium]
MNADPVMQLVRFLEWDSAFFQRRIARVLKTSITDADEMHQIRAWADEHQIDCLYFLCESDSPPSTRLAEANGFHLMDIRVTLALTLATQDRQRPTEAWIRDAEPTDRAALRALSQNSFTTSRFYADAHFAREDCDRLYETWIENSLNDPAVRVLVADIDGAAGYITCEQHGATGEIGLVSVDRAHSGSGIGTALTLASLNYFAVQGLERAEVVTQGRNIVAQRTYQKCGFRTQRTQLWYHAWRNEDDPSE